MLEKTRKSHLRARTLLPPPCLSHAPRMRISSFYLALEKLGKLRSRAGGFPGCTVPTLTAKKDCDPPPPPLPSFQHWQRRQIGTHEGGSGQFLPPREDINAPDLYIPSMPQSSLCSKRLEPNLSAALTYCRKKIRTFVPLSPMPLLPGGKVSLSFSLHVNRKEKEDFSPFPPKTSSGRPRTRWESLCVESGLFHG